MMAESYESPVRNAIAAAIIEKGMQEGAAVIYNECMRAHTESLDNVVEVILNPEEPIENDDLKNIEWCKWLIAGGLTPDEFTSIVRRYDNHLKCGLVWIPHVVAYRCRTCAISPCMSICRNCFQNGDHSTHDFNMFLSQAGGACDCGDNSVMKAEGFCSDHGINNHARNSIVPKELMAVAEAIMPSLLLRLLFHFRDDGNIEACDAYCNMLMELNNMGELMRNVMTATLLDKQLYARILDANTARSFAKFLAQSSSSHKYELAKSRLVSPQAPCKYKDFPALQCDIVHSSLLEELIFWTFKYEFPQNFVCFLLNMLPDPEYKEQLTRTFVMHYSRIPKVLETSKDTDKLSNRVVHMSVQLFSNESLALKMVEELNLLHVMIISLKSMMSQYLVRNTLLSDKHDDDRNPHYVIDCEAKAMREHCYWPLVSDFNNVLSHESVALVFLRDDDLVHMWFEVLSMLQGMNVNVRAVGAHVEREPSSYYAAFSCELEASAYPMWSIISHLNDNTHAQLAKKIIMFCTNYLQDWLKKIYQSRNDTGEVIKHDRNEMMRASFHFPLHRYLAAFTCQAVSKMNMSLKDIIPPPELLTQLMIHPLRIQSFFYEILSGAWIRNGLQIKGQAMTYIQANFCNSMVDMDLFFLQICATQLPPRIFLLNTIESFGVGDWLGMCQLAQTQESEQNAMMEGLLTFLATIVSSRTNLGNDEKAQCIIEISALLATGDKTHSQLLELMPERSGNSHTRIFERYLSELSNFKRPSPSSETLEQGLFIPKPDVWEQYYDPLHVLLRAVHRRDYRNSMDRFQNYVTQAKKMPSSGNLWPPFRLPTNLDEPYSNTSCILQSRILHAMILGILYRALHSPGESEHMLSLAIFLLEIAVMHSDQVPKDALECNQSNSHLAGEIPELLHVYAGDCLAANLRHHVNRIALSSNESQNSPANYSNTTFDSDIEWDVSENESMQTLMPNNAIVDMDVDDVALDVVNDRTLVLRADDDDDSPMHETYTYPSLPASETVQVIAEYSPRQPEEPNGGSGGQQLALLPVGSSLRPSTAAGMEVMVRRTMNLVPANDGTPAAAAAAAAARPPAQMFANPAAGTILPFQRVQPVAVPVRNLDIVASTGNNQRRMFASSAFKAKVIEGSVSDTDSIAIDESILSLLLKLYSQLSGTLDSFSLDEECGAAAANSNAMDTSEPGPSTGGLNSSSQASYRHVEVSDSRIGDGPYFIGNLLRKIARADEGCAQAINDIRRRLWPNQRAKQAEQRAKETKEKEERTKRARERQRKLMEEFARKQKSFMEQAEKEAENQTETQVDEEEYVCIICNRTSPSTDASPFGLVVLIESSGVIGHRRKCTENYALPLEDEETRHLASERFAKEAAQRNHMLTRHFGRESWYLSSNNAFESGIFVQSCGHYVHMDCHGRYLRSLSTSRQSNISPERGEFLCPFCQQLSNAVLPLNPRRKIPTTVGDGMDGQQVDSLSKTLGELANLIKEDVLQLKREQNDVSMSDPRRSEVAREFEAIDEGTPARPIVIGHLPENMRHAMSVITGSSQPKPKNKPSRYDFLFVTSIARTNLEAEIIQKGGSLCSTNEVRYKPKRECLVPLLNLLSVHLLMYVEEWPLWQQFHSLYEVQSAQAAAASLQTRDSIPNLLADPIALLIKYTLLAPLRMDLIYFNAIVKVLYNLLYYQVAVKLCITLTDAECDHILAKYSGADEAEMAAEPSHLGSSMAAVLQAMNRCKHLRTFTMAGTPDDVACASTSSAAASTSSDYTSQPAADMNLNLLEQQLQKLCLPYLRIAALLRHHLYEQALPDINGPQLEFVRLVYYLQLKTDDIAWSSFSAAEALCFVPGTEQALPQQWCRQLMETRFSRNISDYDKAVADFIISQHTLYKQPGLLQLPREYEKLFTFYNEKPCSTCKATPRECTICMVCGTIVCLKQSCCMEGNSREAVRHSVQCGGGKGIFLVVPSTMIIVIRGQRACLWGSLHLDDYYEEDRDLRRGKPLYFSEDRFNLLEAQWLSHRFAHTKSAWGFHRDSL